MLGFRGYMPPEAEKTLPAPPPLEGAMLGYLRVHAPGGRKKFASITPFGGSNAGSFKYKLSTVVQRVSRPAGRPREEHSSLNLGLRLSIEPFFFQLGALWVRCHMASSARHGEGVGAARRH